MGKFSGTKRGPRCATLEKKDGDIDSQRGIPAAGGKADGAARFTKVPRDACEQAEGGLGGEQTQLYSAVIAPILLQVANEEAQKRKNGLADNLEAWKNFEEKRLDCSRMLDMADAELKSLRKNYNMERAPVELQEKVKVAVTMRFVTFKTIFSEQ